MSVRRLAGEWIACEVHDASYLCQSCKQFVRSREQHSHTIREKDAAESWDGQFAESHTWARDTRT